MAKLYYTSSSCGAASFIAAVVAGVHINAEQVDFKTHLTTSGADFYKINPKGNVPCIVLEDGTVLNEGAATLQYIADQVRFRSLESQTDIACMTILM
jgi:glutathione S-transferase